MIAGGKKTIGNKINRVKFNSEVMERWINDKELNFKEKAYMLVFKR